MTVAAAGTLDGDTIGMVLRAVRRRSSGVLLFGSASRGDFARHSDIDVLELAARRERPYRVGEVSVSVYDAATLRMMAMQGRLFVLHLVREGIVLRDPGGRVAECLKAYEAPASYEPYLAELREVARLLDTGPAGYDLAWTAYNDLAVFLLRSAVYTEAAARGEPVFSMEAIRRRWPSPALDAERELKTACAPSFAAFELVRCEIEKRLGSGTANPYGSVEALVVNCAQESSLMAVMGLRLLDPAGSESAYDLFAFPAFGN